MAEESQAGGLVTLRCALERATGTLGFWRNDAQRWGALRGQRRAGGVVQGPWAERPPSSQPSWTEKKCIRGLSWVRLRVWNPSPLDLGW